VQLSWTTPTPEVEFEIVRVQLGSAKEPYVLPIPWRSGARGWGPAEGNDQMYVDGDVAALTAYRYEVRLLNNSGTGAWESVEVTVRGKVEKFISGETYRIDMVQCGTALISGIVDFVHREQREEFGEPKEILIDCDQVSFEKNAVIRTYSPLTIR